MDRNSIFCPNENCKYKITGAGNLKVKQYQGTSQKIALMKCEECGTYFSERKGTVYYGIKKPDYIFDQVMLLLMMRVAIKDITRFIGISEETIGRWIKKAAGYLQALHDRVLKGLEVTECQIDEVWTEWEFMGDTHMSVISWLLANAERYGKWIEHGMPWFESI